MSNDGRFELKIRQEDGPVWRQLLVGLFRGVAIYIAIGLTLALVARLFFGVEAWFGWSGNPSLGFVLTFWGLGWPLLLVLLVLSHSS